MTTDRFSIAPLGQCLRHRLCRPVAALAVVALACAAMTSPGQAQAQTRRFELSSATTGDIQAAMTAGALSSERLIELYLARIAAYENDGPRIRGVIAVNPDALQEARALDAERRATGPRGPLHGVPVLVKDNIDTVQMPTTGGSFVLADMRPTEDSPLIRRLRDAGAIILGKANLDDFAAAGAGFSSVYGQTRNPYNPDYTPLGSSGGSGAVLGAWFATLALGTDTGGSLRSPSSVNGVYGLKPTVGLLSRAGVIPTCYSFDAAGPMARNVTDLAAMLGPMTGIDPADAETRDSLGKSHRDYRIFLGRRTLEGVRIGVIRDSGGADAEVDRLFEEALARLRGLGAELVDPVSYPPQVLNGVTRRAVVQVVCDTEKAVYFDDYLGRLPARYPQTLAELAERGLALREPEGRFSPYPTIYQGLANRVATGQGMESLAYRSAKTHGIEMIRAGVMGVFEAHRLDMVVYPTRPSRPHRIDPDEPVMGYRIPPPQRAPGAPPVGVGLTNIGNITGFPDLVAPAGLTSDGLPVSISFFGPAFSEPRLIEAAHAYEQATEPLPPAPFTPALPGEVFDY